MKTYEFDFAESLGETIMEKYESLFVFLCAINTETKINCAFTHPTIASIFETATVGFRPTPILAQINEMYYCGDLHYPQISFHLFKSEHLANNELILCSEAGNSIVYFKNWIY